MRFAVSLLLVFFLNEPSWSQEVTGNLQGRVLTAEGQPLLDVQITVTGAALLREQATVTDSRGEFRVPSLPVGSYEVRLAHIGYRTVVYEEVPIHLGKTTTLGETRLQVQVIELSPIVVSADPVVIDPTSTVLGTSLPSSTYEALPAGRNYRSIISLLPQANRSYLGDEVIIGGSTGLENLYFIDGINVTDPFRATTGTNLPYNFVEEIEVKEGGYEAEFGRALGGIVNVITYSGGNAFHGEVFGFFTNSTLADNPRRGLLDARAAAFANYDVGLSLGGPILRDKLWFFTAYNPSFESQDIEIPGLGVHKDRKSSHMFAGKLTWQATRNTQIVFSMFGDPATHHAIGNDLEPSPASLGNPDPFLALREEGGVNFSLKGRSLLGRGLLLDASVARYEREENIRGDSERGRTEPLFIDFTTGGWSGGFGVSRFDIHSSRTSAKLSGTLYLETHILKAGLEYEENVVSEFQQSIDPGVIIKTGESAFLVFTAKSDFDVRSRVPTLYIQDSWGVTKRVRLNAGFRWDGQYFIGAGDSVAQAITGQLQPRLGFTFQPGELGSQKIAGSYGRFYQQLPLNLSATSHAVFENCQFHYSADPRDPGVEAEDVACFPPPDTPIAAKVDGLAGEHFDEFTLGYERALGTGLKLSMRGVHRALRAAYGLGFDPAVGFVAGNQGKGDLSFLPEPKRQYTALELTAERTGAQRLTFLVSYVLSRTYGNYTGLFASDARREVPGNNFSLQLPEQRTNSTGLLPNDRTHVLKLFGSYRFDFGFTLGTVFTWQTGTPLNEFGASSLILRPVFLVKRGSAGRTPAIWDLNLRFTYELGSRVPIPLRGRIVLDVLNVGNPRTAVVFDQFRFLALDEEGNQTAENPNYGKALAHQPPMAVRLGLEVEF